jgi:hypothetical protein
MNARLIFLAEEQKTKCTFSVEALLLISIMISVNLGVKDAPTGVVTEHFNEDHKNQHDYRVNMRDE